MHNFNFMTNVKNLYILGGLLLCLLLIILGWNSFADKYFPNDNVIKGEYVKFDDEMVSLEEFNNIKTERTSKHLFCYANQKTVNLNKLAYIKGLKDLYLYNAKIDSPKKNMFSDLKTIYLENCSSTMQVQIFSKKIKKISINSCKYLLFSTELPNLDELDLSNQIIDSDILDSFSTSKKIKRINLSGAENVNLELLTEFKNLKSLNIKDAEVIDYSKLKDLKGLNELYSDSNVKRKYKRFLMTNFKDGDLNTVSEYLSVKYKVKLR